MASKKQNSPTQHCIVDIIVLLDNVRSLHNVGAIFRTCDGAGVSKIYLCGMTGTPPRQEIAKTALGAEDLIPWEYKKDSLRLARKLKAQGYEIVALEKTAKSKLFNRVSYSPKICLIVGHEINGVRKKILEESDKTVHIPMRGAKESLNVATAFGIAIYEITGQLF